jgi:photosystem II stability/assembly factor-like uncharacterized protein
MRSEKDPALGDPDGADESLESVRVEPIAPDEVVYPGARRSASAPGWTKRISTRGKLARALVIALAALVALVVIFPRTNVSLPPAVARLLTPAPTQTPTPGRFTAGEFEQISIPDVPNMTSYAIAPSPRDPATAYTCLFPLQLDPNTGAPSGEISLWITQDAGRTWSKVALPKVIGTNCDVEPAQDGSPRMTMSVTNYALDQSAQPCAHSRFFLGEDGLTWREIQHTSLAPATSSNGDCALWATRRHLFISTNVYSNGDLGQPLLERSDDGGQTWRRADQGLETLRASWYAQPLDSGGESLITIVTRYDSGSLARSDLWITRDAGATWQRLGPATPPTSQVSGDIEFLLTEAHVGGGPQLCHCAYGVSNPYGGSRLAGQHIYRTTDYTRWTPLPPTPVQGTSAARSGVYQVLETTMDGKLLALGADPTIGVPALPDHNGQVSGPPPRLWAWDARVGRWEVAGVNAPCDDLQTCYLYSTGVSVASGADGSARGTYLWLTLEPAHNDTAPPVPHYYRLFIPAV